MDNSSRYPTSLTSALRILDSSVDDPQTNLADMLDAVTARFVEAVDSLVAVNMSLVVDGYPLALIAVTAPDGVVVSTLHLPITVSAGSSFSLVLAASEPGAFTALANDAASEPGVGDGIEQDRHFDAFTPVDSVGDLEDRSTIDRAVGVLLDRGSHLSPAAARDAVIACAHESGRPLVDVARDIVDGATGSPRSD